MRGFRSAGRFQARRRLARGGRPHWPWRRGSAGGRGRGQRFGLARRTGVVVLALAMPPMLMGAGSTSEQAPMPTAAGIRGTVEHLVDWVTGRTPPKPGLPKQQAGKAPGKQHQVPAAVTRAVARAEGHAPGKGAGQLPPYAPHAAKVKRHVTGPADPGGADSFNPASSKLVPSGATATSDLYRNADGSYTRLEYLVPVNRRDASGRWTPIGTGTAGGASGVPSTAGSGEGAARGTLAFSGPSGAGVKGTHVTFASLRVLEAWPGRCPASASVDVSDAGHRVGHWAGKPPASACGSGSKGGWISVPISAAGLRALNSTPGARLTVTAAPVPASQPTSAAPAATPAAPPSVTGTAPAAPATAGPAATAGSAATAPAAAGASPGASASPGDSPAVTAASPRSPAAAGGTAAATCSGTCGTVLMVTAVADTPPQVDDQWPANGYNSPTLTPELIASGSDSDGSPVQYQFSIYDASGTWLAGSKWISANDWMVPSGTLAWDQTYYWLVQAFDSSGTGSLDPQIFALQTPVPQPLVYSGLAQDGNGVGFDPQNGNFTTQATDASVPVTGPALSVQRTYNSLDPRSSGAFGAGWSSVLDMKVSPGEPAADGSDATEMVTYPDGEQVAFGDNGDGTYTPPQGRYGTLAAVSGGFELVDKNDAAYLFTQSLGSGSYGITSISDAQEHALNFTYSSGQITRMTSAVSQRSLHLTWATPSGASHPHVTSVSTGPVTPGNASTAITWQYGYSGDQLSSACNESENGQPCTAYTYQSGSDYPSAVLNSGPRSYWRLDESSGTTAASSGTAASSVLTNEGTDNATYDNAYLDVQPGPLAGSPSSVGAAAFDGSESYVQVPGSLADEAGSMSISLWFNTTSAVGVLFSQSADPITDSTTANPYSPLLYIGSDGTLFGGFPGTGTPLYSSSPVNDGNWHNVVLTSNGAGEALYIDGTEVDSQSVTVSAFVQPYIYVGTGFLGGSYPDEPEQGQTPAATYYSGVMSDVATWDRPLTAATVAALYAAGTHPAALLTKITRPSGKTFEQASYDAATSDVTHVTDSNGGSWTVAAPAVSGSSQVYAASVEGAQPEDYWRLADTGTSTAVNQVKAGTATYNDVTQGQPGGPFADTTVDGFNGSSSYLALPDKLISPGNQSVSLWFKTTATDGMLLSSSADPISDTTTSNAYTANLYIGDDGYLNGEFDNGDAPMSSSGPVNDGKWHNIVMAAGTSGQVLYLDGQQVGTASGTIGGGTSAGEDNVYVGAGFLGGDWVDQPHYSDTDPTGYQTFFTGDIAEVAVYPHQLTAADVTAEWDAAQHSPGLTPVETATVTDPGGHALTDRYDPLNSGRMLSQTDGLGNTTTYGYDSGGFQDRVTDPDGNVTDTGFDIRGNMVSKTTCQDQAAGQCSTGYYTYSPNDTAATLTSPYSGNDLVTTYRDPRSASATDNTYLTTSAYNSAGELTSVKTPPVPGYPSGRTTKYAYTDGTSTAGSADGTTVPPAGLLWKTTTPGGAVTQTLYDAYGNVVETINADGLTTCYTYDGIGRKTSQTVYSDTYPDGLTTSYAYDADGRVTQETDPAVTNRVTGAVHTPQITTAYDADGDIVSKTTADTTGGDASRTVSYTYNSHDEKASSTDATGAVTYYSYDSYGNLGSQTDPAGNETIYSYDPNGNLLTTTLWNYTGSPSGSQSAAPLTEESRAYDPAGRLASVTDAMGRVTSYAYTDNGLTATITRGGPGGGSFVQEADTYDPAGNLVKKVTDNGATTTSYAVDAASQVTSQTLDPGGLDRVTAYTYDPDDHVAAWAASVGGGSPVQSTYYTYDPMGNKTSQTVDDPGAEGPAGWWTLTQSSGTTVSDTSGTGNLATASGVTWTGSGAQLSGQGGQQIATRGPVVDTTGSFSVSAWVKMAGSTGNDQSAVSQDAGSVAGFYLGLDSGTGTWKFTRPEEDQNDPPDWATADSGATAQAGAWTFLTGVYNASTGTVRLYVNGAGAGSASDPSPIAAGGPLEIGAGKYDGQAGTVNFDGSITNVEAYPTALSAAEVANLYGQGRTGGDLTRDALTTNWTVDQLGQVVTQTNPDGIATSYQYDEAGRMAVTVGPPVAAETGGGAPLVARPTTTTGYDTFGDVTESQDPDGNVTTYAYDADGGQVAKTLPSYTQPGASSPVNGTSTTQYNALGQVTAQTDPLGNTTKFAYDQLGDRTSQTDPGGGVTTTAYDANGEVLSQTGPTGAQTTATYDYLGRQLTATDVERYPSPASYTTTTSYAPTAADPGGTWKSSVTTPDGVTTSYGYDAAGETTQVTDGAGNTTGYSYDALGRQTATLNPDGTSTTVSYDPAGNKVATSSLSASGQTLTTQTATYNGEGQQLSATDALGDTTAYTYDPVGDLTAETQPVTSSVGIVTSFGYDTAGNQTRYTDGRGNQWLTTYNSWNLPENQVEPATSQNSSAADSTTTTAYNGDGQPVTATEPGGVTITDTYNAMGDLTGQAGTGATAPTANRSFSYDAAGDMLAAGTSSTAASGQPSNATSETFTYNDRGLPLTASGSAGSTAYTWNGDGQQISVQDAAGTTSYGYDNAGRLRTMNDPASGTTLTYSYNAMSQVSQVSYGTGADVRAFGYDSLHRLTSDTLTSSSGTTIASIAYGYDADGNLTSKTTTGFAGASANTYAYDQAGRLTSWNNGAATTSYAYDAAGNRVKAGNVSYTYDARDELTSDGTSTYSYTANGDLSSVSGPSGTVTSTTDAYGQQGAQGSQTDTYDALGRDVGTAVTGGSATTLSYEGSTGQLTSDGTAAYTWTPDGTLTGTAPAGDPGTGVLDLTDRHSDLTGQFTATGTALTGSHTFGPWGAVTATGGTLTGALGYQSQYTSPATGQVDMGARWYNPATGSFGNRDTVANKPVPNSASASPFGYAADNPLDATDPAGHAQVPVAGGGSASTSNNACIANIAACMQAAGLITSGGKVAPPSAAANLAAAERAAEAAAERAAAAAAKKAAAAKAAAAAAAKKAAAEKAAAEKAAAAKAAAAEAAAAKAATSNPGPGCANANIYNVGECLQAAWTSHGGQTGANGIPVDKGYNPSTSPPTQAQIDAQVARATQAANKEYPVVTGTKESNPGVQIGVITLPSSYPNVGQIRTGYYKYLPIYLKQFGVPDIPMYQLDAFNVFCNGSDTGGSVALCGGTLSWKLEEAYLGQFAGASVFGVAADLAGLSSADRLAAKTDSYVADQAAAIDQQFGDGCLLGGSSFTPGTLVLLASGKAVPIASLKPGDKVLATNTSTGKTGAESVAAVEVNHDTDLYDLNVKTSSGTEIIHTTSNHLFWDPKARKWVQAGDLKPGESLKTPAGTPATADGGTIPATHDGWMWDLTIPGNNDHDFYVIITSPQSTSGGRHTYYVDAGSTPVLVHNENPASSRVPDLTGKTQAEADQVLGDEGFSLHSISQSGAYATYQASDGSRVTIRLSDGRVTRTSTIDMGPNIKNRTQRWGQDGQPTDSHNTGENLSCG